MDKTYLSNSLHFHDKVLGFVSLSLIFLTSSLASQLLAFHRPPEVNLRCSHEHPSQGGLGTANVLDTANLLSGDRDRTQGNGSKLHWVEGWGWERQLD